MIEHRVEHAAVFSFSLETIYVSLSAIVLSAANLLFIEYSPHRILYPLWLLVAASLFEDVKDDSYQKLLNATYVNENLLT